MTIVSVVRTVFFTAIGVVVVTVISAVGGVVGGGSALAILSLSGSRLLAGLLGGAIAGLVFTRVSHVVRRMLEVEPPKARNLRLALYGYVTSTLFAVHAAALLRAQWQPMAIIILSGALSLLTLYLAVGRRDRNRQ